MDRLQELKAEKMRLEVELEGQADDRKSVDLMIDIATVDAEIADLEWKQRKLYVRFT